MEAWKPDWILKALVCWIAFMLVFSWLPLVRVLMDGVSYTWGTTHFGHTFSSAGWHLDAWLLVAKAALLGGLLFGALRGAGILFRQVLVFWSLLLAADVMQAAIRDPGGFEFHGDTLGIHLNLGLAVVLVVAGFAALAIYWVVREGRRGEPERHVPWTRRNARLLRLFAALLPLQFVLLRFGEPHGTTDAIGVLITIASCPLLAVALYPWPPRDEGLRGPAPREGLSAA